MARELSTDYFVCNLANADDIWIGYLFSLWTMSDFHSAVLIFPDPKNG